MLYIDGSKYHEIITQSLHLCLLLCDSNSLCLLFGFEYSTHALRVIEPLLDHGGCRTMKIELRT
jgi:hypothetical protein